MASRSIIAATLFAAVSAAEATVWELNAPVVQQTAPGSPNASTGVTTGDGTWTWNDETNVITQTAGTTTVTMGPQVRFGNVGYVMTMQGFEIAADGATTGTYTCTDGAFAAVLNASFCGGYNFNTGGDQSTLSADAEIRTLGGDDAVGVTPTLGLPQPTIAVSNMFNDSSGEAPTPGGNGKNQTSNLMVTRDLATGDPGGTLNPQSAGSMVDKADDAPQTGDILRVRPSAITTAALAAPNSPAWGEPNSGWELRFVLGEAIEEDVAVASVPMVGWVGFGALAALIFGISQHRLSRGSTDGSAPGQAPQLRRLPSRPAPRPAAGGHDRRS